MRELSLENPVLDRAVHLLQRAGADLHALPDGSFKFGSNKQPLFAIIHNPEELTHSLCTYLLGLDYLYTVGGPESHFVGSYVSFPEFLEAVALVAHEVRKQTFGGNT